MVITGDISDALKKNGMSVFILFLVIYIFRPSHLQLFIKNLKVQHVFGKYNVYSIIHCIMKYIKATFIYVKSNKTPSFFTVVYYISLLQDISSIILRYFWGIINSNLLHLFAFVSHAMSPLVPTSLSKEETRICITSVVVSAVW